MLALVLSMLVILLLAGLVAAYVAYPHRGRALPAVPWLGAALRRGVDRLPTVGGEDHAVPSGLALTRDEGPQVPPQRREPQPAEVPQRRGVAPSGDHRGRG